MKLCAKMKMLREMHELTQVQLVEKAGVTQAYIARIESYKVLNPKVSGIAGLARILGVPVEVLLDDHLTLDSWRDESKMFRIDNATKELIDVYNILRPKDKQLVLDFTRLLHQRG